MKYQLIEPRGDWEITPFFSRVYEEMSEDSGLTFEEAKEVIIKCLLTEVNYWQNITVEEYFDYED